MGAMTVAAGYAPAVYAGDGVAYAFPFTWPLLDAAHLAVTKTSGGVTTTLVRNVDYLLTWVGAGATGSIRTIYMDGGTPVNDPPAYGDTVTINRVVPISQETDIRNRGPFLAETVERGLDRQAMISQQLSTTMDGHASSHLPGGDRAIDWGRILGRGSLIDRPDASGNYAGCYYYVEEDRTLYQCDGSAWIAMPMGEEVAADAATKGYVDGLVNGTDWKASVRVATAAAGTLATSFSNGQTVDDIALVTGNRILIKDQAAPAENGIYTVNASGAPTRAVDMDAWTEVPGSAVTVEIGTANADKTFVCTADQGGTLGTTAITWVNISSGTIAADSVDNTKLSNMAQNTIKGRVSAGAGDPEDLTAAQVRTIIGSPQKYSALVGNGSLTTIPVAHNLGVTGSVCMVYEATGSLREVLCEKQCTNTNTWTLLFATAPAANSLRVVVIG